MNPLYEIMNASEAARLWDLDESTVRRAIWERRMPSRKSGGVNLVTQTAMREKYGPMPAHNASSFIEEYLTSEDVTAWHEECTATPRVEELMEAVGVDCIQIWGSYEGSEPVSVNLC